MAQTVAGMDKQTLAKALAAGGAAFGLLSIVAPRVVATGYGVPVTPAGLQLQRLFGSRSLAISALGLTARTDDEVDRGLAAVAAMNLLDSVTALAAAATAGRPGRGCWSSTTTPTCGSTSRASSLRRTT